MMRKLILPIAFACGLSACANADEELIYPRDDTSDFLLDYTWDIAPNDEVHLDEIYYEGELVAEERQMRDGKVLWVQTPMVIFDPREQDRLNITVSSDGLFDSAVDELRFLLFYEDPTRKNDSWQPFIANGKLMSEGDAKPLLVQINMFESMVFDRSTDSMKVYTEQSPDGLIVHEVGLAKQTGRLAIFVVPASTWWGSLAGRYDFKLDVSCGQEERACLGEKTDGKSTPEDRIEPISDQIKDLRP